MLVEFSVENFRSIKTKATLSLVASPNKEIQNNVSKIQIPKNKNSQKEINLLKSIAIFGANASGKSNVLMALNQSIYSILFSQSFQPNQEFPIEQFKVDERYTSKPSCFEFKFIKNGVLFVYSYKVLKNEVFEENLDYCPQGRTVKIFSRNHNNIVFHTFKNANNEDKIRLKIYEEEISSNILILSLANKIKIPAIMEAYNWFQKNTCCLLNVVDTGWMTAELLASKTIDYDIFNQLLKCADPFINKFQLEQKIVPYEQLPQHIQLDIRRQMERNKEKVLLGAAKIEGYTYSNGIDINGNPKEIKFLLEANSAGTLKYFGIIGQIIRVLSEGGVLIVDELELRLHPNLSRMIVELFSSEYNKKNAQLVFTTHNTNLLDTKNILRRDQIYFVQKNNVGESELYSLLDFNVRNDKVIQKAYLDGIFGAIPNICFEDLICQ